AGIGNVHALLDSRLDAGRPFDGASLDGVRRLIEWLQETLIGLKAGVGPVPFVADLAAPASAESAHAAQGSSVPWGDQLLELNLAENKEILGEFYAEAVEHLQQIEAALLTLDQQPDHPEALSAIFRSFHTIKGNAGFLGLVPMHVLAHEVESLLDLARNNQLRLTPPIITEILHSRDALQALTQQIAKALERGQIPQTVVPVSHLIQAVKAFTKGAPAPVSAPAPMPPPILAADFFAPPPPVATAKTPATPAPLAAVVPLIPPVASVSSAPVSEAAALANRIEAQAAQRSNTSGHTVRVSTDKLDSLMDVVGELAIVQSQLIESARALGDDQSLLQRNVTQLSRIAKELQHTSMSLRMIPVKPTFQKMERLVRDLARNFSKKVNFQVTGEDTELDRTVVEEIADPLVHMVRNALDHGLESSSDRVAAGKPEQGTVHLRAYHQGSNIVIELKDDGRGIDPEKILKKAVEKGIVSEHVKLTTEEIFALLFAPGFSTAENITAFSGRGVGMDVVKRNIDKLRGKIEIESVVGTGSTFRIKLPLTMAIIDGLVVRVGLEKFILPSTSVQMALRPTREAISTVHGSGEVLELRGRILPLHRLHRRFGIPADSDVPWEGIVVIVEHAGRVSALLVDEMVSKQEVVIKNLGAFMQGLPGISGAAILGDGHIALILDPASLLHAA
ncbi:MAG: chemotaxis protein CheA, partial [Candidatus Didemnitutus sp.]|nr:chemotaxis protein CheA [Candidatus Didemnitutus sp.]